MLANRVLDFILTMLAWVVLPVQLATTFLLGILVTCTFGLLLFPLSLVWAILVFPLVGASWLCSKAQVLRNPIGILLIPWVVVANTYACLVPSMGEMESRADKLLLTETWPFCWEYWQFGRGHLEIHWPEADRLREILDRVCRNDALRQRTVDRLAQHEQLDPNV
jgi:hypothetical protein